MIVVEDTKEMANAKDQTIGLDHRRIIVTGQAIHLKGDHHERNLTRRREDAKT